MPLKFKCIGLVEVEAPYQNLDRCNSRQNAPAWRVNHLQHHRYRSKQTKKIKELEALVHGQDTRTYTCRSACRHAECIHIHTPTRTCIHVQEHMHAHRHAHAHAHVEQHIQYVYMYGVVLSIGVHPALFSEPKPEDLHPL